MRWWLQVVGRAEEVTSLVPSQVGPSDEFLCGNCSALLAVDHQLWNNVRSEEEVLTCSVCSAKNRRGHVTRSEPS